MRINISNVVSSAYRTVKGHKVLWVLGLFVAALSGTSGSVQWREEGRIRIFDVDITPSPETIAVLVMLGLLLVVGLFLVRAILDAGLIAAGDRSAQGLPPTLGEAWRAGRARVWPVLGLNLIFAGVMILATVSLALVAGLAVGGLIMSGLVTTDVGTNLEVAWRTVAAIGAGVVGVLALVLILVVLAVAFGLTMQLGQRAAVLDHQNTGEALSTGWRLMRENLGSSIQLLLIQLMVNLVVSTVMVVIFSPVIAIVAGAAVGGADLSQMLIWLLPLMAAAWILAAIIRAVPTAWSSVLWTLFYRAATVGSEAAPGQEPLSGRQLSPPMPGVYGG